MKKSSIWWACTLIAGLAGGPAHAQSTTTDCSTVANDLLRLTCYDEQAANRKAAAAAAASTSAAPASAARAAAAPAVPAAPSASTSAAPAAATARAAAPVAAPATSGAAAPSAPAPAQAAAAPKPSSGSGTFGAESIQKSTVEHSKEPKASAQITARVSSVDRKPRGDYRVTLEDGQVWEETQHTGGPPPEAGETVTIRRGALGSYFLSRSKGGLALRVTRTH